MVFVARRGAAGGEDHVGLLRAAVECGAKGVAVVGDAAQVDGREPELLDQSQEHGAVGVEDLAGGGGGARFDQFVAGGQHRDAQRRVDRKVGVPGGREEREVGGGEPAALAKNGVASPYVLARLAGVGAGLDAGAEGDGGVAGGDVLLQDDRVDAPGQRGAGEDADGMARGHGALERHAGGGASGDEGQGLVVVRQAGMVEAITVDGGVGQGRVGPLGSHIGGKDPAAGAV